MKQLRNKAGDLAMVVDTSPSTDGMTVLCHYYDNISDEWLCLDRENVDWYFSDEELLPLGGEHILQGEPLPELTQGSEAEIEKEEL